MQIQGKYTIRCTLMRLNTIFLNIWYGISKSSNTCYSKIIHNKSKLHHYKNNKSTKMERIMSMI